MSSPEKPSSTSELSQSEREAIVDLLQLCLFADSHVASKEGEFISKVVDQIGWETQSSYGSYEARSIAAARAAKENADQRKIFLESAAERLKSGAARVRAVEYCERLFASDGSTVDRETQLLREIRTILRQ